MLLHTYYVCIGTFFGEGHNMTDNFPFFPGELESFFGSDSHLALKLQLITVAL